MTLVMNISCTGSPQTKRMVIHEGESICIGRSNSAASLIVDARLSRSHFNIHYGGGQIRIEHLSTTNPTVVASQGSSDFQKVVGERVESQGCRIIAGSHRYVLSVVTPEEVGSDSFSVDATEESVDEVNSKFWSDVTPAPEQSPTANEIPSTSEPFVDEKSAIQESPASEESPASDLPREQPTFIDVDDSYFAPPTKPEAPVKKKQPPVEQPAKQKPAKPEPDESKREKPFFPITDDFFDD